MIEFDRTAFSEARGFSSERYAFMTRHQKQIVAVGYEADSPFSVKGKGDSILHLA